MYHVRLSVASPLFTADTAGISSQATMTMMLMLMLMP
jgi:hypothetical protein